LNPDGTRDCNRFFFCIKEWPASPGIPFFCTDKEGKIAASIKRQAVLPRRLNVRFGPWRERPDLPVRGADRSACGITDGSSGTPSLPKHIVQNEKGVFSI
jgi:hypothetical protein